MKKSILILAGAALLFAGCAKVENDEVVPEKGKRHVTLKATVNEPDTRVSVDMAGVYSWQAGDEIGVVTDQGFYGSIFTNDSGETASFEFDVDEGETLKYALYPSPDDCTVPAENEDFIFSLNTEYAYIKDASYMPMLGTISSDGISFKSVGGVLKLIIYNVPENAARLLFSMDNMRITGEFPISGGMIEAETQETDGDVTINFTGKREDNMVFYIPLPTGTYDGFELSFLTEQITDIDGASKRAHIDGGLTVNRNDVIIAPALNMATAGVPMDDATLSNEDIVSAHDNNDLGTSYGQYTITNAAGQDWMVNDGSYQGNYGGSHTYYIQLKKNSGWIKLPTFETSITSITVHRVVNTSEGQYEGTLHLKSESSSSTSLASGTTSTLGGDIELNPPANTKTGYLISDAAIRIYAITVSFSGQTPATTPSIYTPHEDATIAAGNLTASIDGVKIVNPLDGQGIVATTDADWLTVEFEGGNWSQGRKLKATANSYNHGESERTATVTLRATGCSKTITIKQNPSVVTDPTELSIVAGNKSFEVSWAKNAKVDSYVAYYSDTELTNPSNGTELTPVLEGETWKAVPDDELVNDKTYYVYVKAAALTSSYVNKYIISDVWATSEVVPVDPNAKVIIAINFTTDEQRPSGFPYDNDHAGKNLTSYSIAGYDFSFYAKTAYYWINNNSNKYFIIGKKGSYILFPAIEGKKLSKVKFATKSGSSPNVVPDIFNASGTTPIYGNTSPLPAGATYEWSLGSTSTNTRYQFRITSDHNIQLTSLELTYE